MFIKKDYPMGFYSAKYIQEHFCRENEAVLYTRLDNQHIAILVPSYGLETGLPAPIITLDIERQIPLWKQSMNLQMGKMPKSSQSERVTKQIRWLNEGELHGNMRFEVYRCVG